MRRSFTPIFSYSKAKVDSISSGVLVGSATLGTSSAGSGAKYGSLRAAAAVGRLAGSNCSNAASSSSSAEPASATGHPSRSLATRSA